jgi:hypothetical protein
MSRISDLKVEQLALGELDPEEARAVEAALEADGDERLAEIQASNEAIVEELAPAAVAAEVRRRVEEREPRGSRAAWLAVPVMAAAGLLLWVATADDPEVAPADATPAIYRDDLAAMNDTVRIKGSTEPHLLLYRKRDQGEEKLEPGQAVSAGDVLQISYVAAGRQRGVVLSIDGGGAVTLHHPTAVGEPARLQERGETPLPHGYELDDAPEFERFFFVTPEDAGGEIDVAAVIERAQSLASEPEAARERPLPVPDTLQQWSLVVRKGNP